MKNKSQIIERIEMLTNKRQEYAQMLANDPDVAYDIAPEIAILTYQIEALYWCIGQEVY